MNAAAADPLHDVMPHVSRALKNNDRRRATNLLSQVVDPRVARRAVHIFTDAPGPFAPTGTVLSPAEFAVVWNAACGLDGHETAKRFHRSYETVKKHRQLAFRRLGVKTISQAVAECYRRNIFDRDDPLIPLDW